MSDYERDVSPIQEQNVERLQKLIPDSLPDGIKQALKSSIEVLSNKNAEEEKLEEYVHQINSDDITIQYNGLNQCRKLLSNVQQAAPTEQIIDLFLQTKIHVKIFEIAKNTNIQLLRYEALWIICNIGIGNQQQIQSILDNHVVDILLEALQSQHEEIIELAVWALANIAGDNINFRDMILELGVLKPFIQIARNCIDKNKEIFKTLVWAFTNLARGQPIPKKKFNVELVKILCEILVSTDDEELLIDVSWGLSYLSQDDTIIGKLIEKRVIQKLTQLLNSSKQNLIIPSLRTLGNILTGNDEQTEKVLQFGVIQIFEKLLQNKNKKIRKEACWSLSNIAGGAPNQVKQIIRNDSLLKFIFLQLEQGNSDIIQQISFLMSNSVVQADLLDIDYLVTQYDFIKKMSKLLDSKDILVIRVALEGIQQILKRVQYDQRQQQYKKLIVDNQIMVKVDLLKNHKTQDINENALSVIQIFNSEVIL